MIGIASRRVLSVFVGLVLAGALAASLPARGDEGMWTYDRVPAGELEKRYGFVPTREWLDHLRLSSVNVHASASFVSPDGLILTNHHVALFSVQRLSTPEHNYVREGFYARTRAEEAPIPGMTVRVLVSMEDVTARVDGAVKAGAQPALAKAQQQGEIARLEAECQKTTGLRGQVVDLYGGARHVLYRYKEYTDVRLVFAPELQAAFFGGDDDNFCYPRYDLDMAFLRAYEDGKPAHVADYLKVDPDGAKEGDLVFVSGHPGKTERLVTMAGLVYDRDVEYPAVLARLRHLQTLLRTYSARGPEEARRARTSLYFVANSLKAREGEYRGLSDKTLMDRKASGERALRRAVYQNPKLEARYGRAWAKARAAYDWARQHEKEIRYEMHFGGRNLAGAFTLLRYAEEMAKPDADRLEGFHDAELAGTLRYVTAPGPYHKDLEELMLADEMAAASKALGPQHPFVRALLKGDTPEVAARKAIEGTRMGDAGFRRSLLEDGGKAVASCADPLLDLVRRIDPAVRDVQKRYRDSFEAVVDDAQTQVANAMFAVYGDDLYPDATGTLRLAFGKVAGYPFATTVVPAFTTFYGLYDRSYSFGNSGEFALTKREEERRDRLDLATPLNMVCTADITGGNSGSPVVNREGRLVGLVFDGNMESHPNTFLYDETQARCVAVDIRAILEALTKLYDAQPLSDEMLASAK